MARVDYDPETDTLTRNSYLSKMENCEWKIGYMDHPGYLEAVSEPLVFGTCAHYMIEQDLRTGHEQLDLVLNMKDWVEQLLVEQYDWTLDLVPDVHHFFSELGVAYRTWRNQVRPNLDGEPIALEETMHLPLGPGKSGTIILHGTPDIVYPHEIRDVKTTGRMWHESRTHFSTQPATYMALVKQQYRKSIRNFVFDIYDRRKSTWHSLPTKRSIPAIDSVLRNHYNAGLKIESKIFTAKPYTNEFSKYRRGWYCSTKYCSAWNVCEFKYMADDVDEAQEAERTWK